MNTIETATVLALRAHAGQMRKEANVPYIIHPIAVALILARHGFKDDVVAAALLHDVVEDTPVTIAMVREELGDTIANLVAPVTHDDSLSWEDKKKAYIESVRESGDEVKAISVADKIANAHSLLNAYEIQGEDIWKYFNAGRKRKLWFERAMFTMLEETWSHPLVDEYKTLVIKMENLV